MAARQVLEREVDAALADVDALVLPTLAIVAPTLGAESVEIGDRREAAAPGDAAADAAVQPVAAPGRGAAVRNATGLPVSLQVVGKHARTGALLDLCAALAPIAAAG